jgi:hypothetical protein
MKRVRYMALICVVILSLFSSLVLYASAYGRQAHLMVVEWYGQGRGRVILYSIPSEDDSMTNPDYELLPFWWRAHRTALAMYLGWSRDGPIDQ